MENDSTTLREPLLEKDIEKQPDESLADDPEEALIEALSPTNHGDTGDPNNDDGSTASFVFTIASELSEMANLAWPLAVSFFCRMGMASTDSAFVGHIPG